MEWISLLLAIVLIAGCGLFVAAEFSLITVNRNQVKQAAESGDRRASGVLKGMSTCTRPHKTDRVLSMTLFFAQRSAGRRCVQPFHILAGRKLRKVQKSLPPMATGFLI